MNRRSATLSTNHYRSKFILRPSFRSKFILRFDFLDITVRHEIGKCYISTEAQIKKVFYRKGLGQRIAPLVASIN